MKFDSESISKLKEVIATPKKVVITTHRNPDGDANYDESRLQSSFAQKTDSCDPLKWNAIVHGADARTGP